ncbi:hypothetical protein C8Q77DRAFT_1071286 [Trametes polyzona]|nr:hypothetical protein C8Q77DRAFT_1071286 [Trametes polyzona]
MLAGLRQAAPLALRQCCSGTTPVVRCAQQVRTLACSSVLREAPETKASRIPQPPGPANPWSNLLNAAQRPGKGSNISPEELWSRRENTIVRTLPPPNNAYSGRSVPVINGQVSFALTKLKSILAVNAVRQTAVRDERHEKKGEKRNRLRSLRWRRRFAHEVRKKVQLVNEIRARGA